MTNLNRCPNCGCDLPTNAPAELCPECLLRQGFAENDSLAVQIGPDRKADAGSSLPATTPPAQFDPPSVEELASLFPGLEILKLLGHGGMGAVYQARQTKLDRLVALKIIRPESASDLTFAERFLREARTLARLNHPSIVGVHDFGEVKTGSPPEGTSTPGTLYYFVMEYVDGANLRQLIEIGELTPETAVGIVPQVCEALQFAHDEGVVHRDIKPENILVDSRGQVKIADFGLARLIESSPKDFTLTGTHQVMGTPRYMAPEQMEGSHNVDHRADIYSLGVVFYEMLTGQVPVGHFDPPSKKVQIDVRLDEVVLRSLAREPERRYQQVSEVKTDVESVSQRASSAVVQERSPLAESNPASSVQSRHSDPALAETSPTLSGSASEPLPAYVANPEASISRKAITGTALILVGGLLFPFVILKAGSVNDSDVAVFLTGLMILLALVTAIVASGLGVVAIKEIRRSGGRLCGLRLAFLNAVLCPTIAVNFLVNVAIHLFCSFWIIPLTAMLTEPGSIVEAVITLTRMLMLLPMISLLVQGMISFRIVRSYWQKVSGEWPSAEEAAATPRAEFCWKAAAGFFSVMLFLVQLDFFPVLHPVLDFVIGLVVITATDGPGPGLEASVDIQGIATLLSTLLCGVIAYIIGRQAIHEIRKSNGKLWGLGLAFTNAAVLPIVLLDTAIFGVVLFAVHSFGSQEFLSSGLGAPYMLAKLYSFPIWLFVDWLILSRMWKRVACPVAKAAQ